MDSNRIKISVIVCTYNRDDVLRFCLDSLVAQTINPSLFEVIIVNNNSTDTTADIANEFVEQYDHFRLVNESKQGLSHARNRGWQEARGTYVAYIDDDAKATPHWVERIVDAFESIQPTPSAVGGPIYPYYTEKMPIWFADDMEIRTWGEKKHFLESSSFSGSNMTFFRKILQEYNGFSHEFGMQGTQMAFGEETDLFNKIYQKQPYFWYDPEIKVYHHTPPRNAKFSWRLKRNYKIGKASMQMLLAQLQEKGKLAAVSNDLIDDYLTYGFLKTFVWRINLAGTVKGLVKQLFSYLTTFSTTVKIDLIRAVFKNACYAAFIYGNLTVILKYKQLLKKHKT